MPKNFVRKTFDRWLCRNRMRFNYQPMLVKKRKRYFLLQFAGITPEIVCLVRNTGVGVWVLYRGDCWDGLAHFDVAERRAPSGHYYCELCEPEKREMFSSREALWEEHCFEPLLEWTNEEFHVSRWLCLLGGIKDGYTAAILKQKDEMDDMATAKDFVHAFPVVRYRGYIKHDF